MFEYIKRSCVFLNKNLYYYIEKEKENENEMLRN